MTLSRSEARRVALAALGFARKRPARPGIAQMRRVIHELGLLQIDSVNVLVQAHYLVMFSRLGPYDRGMLDRLIYSTGEFTERWAHEASIVPVELWPLLKHRMETHRARPWGFEAFMDQFPDYAGWVLDQVRLRGPLRGEDLAPPEGSPRRLPGTWYSNVGRGMLEAHFGRGVLAVTNRGANFAREFDLAERVIPSEHLTATPLAVDAQRELVRKAAAACGVGTAADLADYFRMRPSDCKARIGELVEARELEVVSVEGWRDTAYLWISATGKSAKMPKVIDTAALLSPFDPVVWFRPRAERLFDFRYRIEIYTPEAKRKFGYYVLPFLCGERLVGRVDLKADREAGRLRVLAAHIEDHAEPEFVASKMMEELAAVSSWLGLAKIEISRRGNLAPALSRL